MQGKYMQYIQRSKQISQGEKVDDSKGETERKCCPAVNESGMQGGEVFI